MSGSSASCAACWRDDMRGKSLMIQGTASNVGKSVLCAAILRIMKQDGLRAAPFKAQNMALNSFVTRDGLEIGRAQATQAQAAGIEPDVRMNPVLLKPTGDRRSQVILDGRPAGNLSAEEYQRRKPALRGHIRDVYQSLENDVDCVVIEGAGSPAEINLRDGDIVNMAMAEAADAPVLLVGDIDPGGVFASLLGTMMLLTDEERARVKGVIINKFRGDIKLLEPGIAMLEERIRVPVLGVIPWMDVELEDEDSITDRFEQTRGTGDLSVAVVRLAHISNFTDFQALTLQPGARVYYAQSPKKLEGADLVILPGTKNTIEDLAELRRQGMDEAIRRCAARGCMVLGVCGGYQMLGRTLSDPEHVESRIPSLPGLGLLDMRTDFSQKKTTAQVTGTVDCPDGWLSALNGTTLEGYEIHAGRCSFGENAVPWLRINGRIDGVMNAEGNVLGTHLHGLFDDGLLFGALAAHIREREFDCTAEPLAMEELREREFDFTAKPLAMREVRERKPDRTEKPQTMEELREREFDRTAEPHTMEEFREREFDRIAEPHTMEEFREREFDCTAEPHTMEEFREQAFDRTASPHTMEEFREREFDCTAEPLATAEFRERKSDRTEKPQTMEELREREFTRTAAPLTMAEFREREFDRIAAIVRASLDMEAVYRIVRGEE